jgi:hypothetical protein
MGALPEWYSLLRAARYLQVAPWELAARPVQWMDYALIAETAEHEARAIMAKQTKAQKTKGRRK